MKTITRRIAATILMAAMFMAANGSSPTFLAKAAPAAKAEGGGGDVAGEKNPLHPVAVSAFKNGLAFVLRQGEVSLDDGKGVITAVPQATLGTLWISATDAGTSMDEVVAGRTRIDRARPIANMGELILANVGRTLTLIDGRQKEYTGEIVGLTYSENYQPKPDEAPVVPKPMPEMVLIKVNGKTMALKLYSIEDVILPEDSKLMVAADYADAASLRFKVRGASSKANLTMGYLEKGLGWTPSYLVSLTDDHTAQITMQSVVVNDAEPLKDAEVFFVVGVPNFQYSNMASPMSLQGHLLDYMQLASNGPRRDLYSNALKAQSYAQTVEVSAASPAVDLNGNVENLNGSPEEDLFLYSRKGVTLAMGERGMYNVFSAAVNYEHVYEWQVRDPLRVDAYGNVQQGYAQQDQDAGQEVWHSIRLKDTTNYPWTSAPAMVIRNNKPLSQDTLNYTPKGASSNLKLTIASDVRAQSKELEIAREPGKPDTYTGYHYQVVTVEGTLKIRNHKSKDLKLNISKIIRGEVKTQSEGGTNQRLAEGINAMNPLSELKWEVSVEAGSEKEIKYQYRVWVRG